MSGLRVHWSVAGASVRGASHQRAEIQNQDAFECVEAGADTPAIVAVADGHGSALHFRSHIGSALGVSVAIAEVQKLYRRRAEAATALFAESDLAELAHSIVQAWRRAVASDLEQQPFDEGDWASVEVASGAYSMTLLRDAPEIAYGATLLVAAATATQLIYLQLGDGEILAVDAAGRTWRPLPADDRLTGNQTTSLCQPEAWKEFRSGMVQTPGLPALLLLSTDGYVNSFRSDDDFLQTGTDYLRMVRDQGMAALKDEMPGILAEASQHGSGDDISLVVLQGDTRARPDAAEESVAAARRPQRDAAASSAGYPPQAATARPDLSSELASLRLRNRRLRQLLVLLLLLAVLVPAVIFRRHLSAAWASLHPRHVVPCGAGSGAAFPCGPGHVPHTVPLAQPGEPVPLAAPAPSAGFVLHVPGSADIALVKGAVIAASAVEHGGHGRYAEVASDHGLLELINRSDETWKAHGADKKDRAIPPGGSVRVQAGTVILFHPGERGMITRVQNASIPVAEQ